MTQSYPRPDHLGERGGRFWDAVSGSYQLRPDEMIVLEDACREIDLVDRLEAELRTADLIVTGGYEQEVANPLITEIRQHRGVVARLVNQLKIPDGESAAPPLSRSDAARKAANARWAKTP